MGRDNIPLIWVYTEKYNPRSTGHALSLIILCFHCPLTYVREGIKKHSNNKTTPIWVDVLHRDI